MPYGFQGVTLAAGALFLSYTGFDVVANAAEESKNPERDVTIALIGSILISMVLYVVVAMVLVGISNYTDLNNKEPLAYALKMNGSPLGGTFIAIGCLFGMTAVVLVQIYGLSRVMMAMSRDRLLPKFLSKIHPKYRTPYLSTISVGIVMSLVSGFVPMKVMGDLSSLGTLVVLVFITISAVRLRKLYPELKRPFKCPALWFIAPLALLLCGYLILSLLSSVGKIFACYIITGIALYFFYSHNKDLG
jgi:APA family basic amino acid/polyamine antiporter